MTGDLEWAIGSPITSAYGTPIRRRPGSWRHHIALAQVIEERQEGEAEDGEVAAVDPVEQLHAGTLDPVGADAPADRLPFAVQIVVEEGVTERAHRQAHRLAAPPDRLPVLDDHRRRVKAVSGAAERQELI